MKKSVLITGSSKGLGAELAKAMARDNYNLIIHGRDKVSLKNVEREIIRRGVDCEIVLGDIRLDETIEKLYGVAKRKNIEVLINNAGIYENNNLQKILEVNLIAPIKLTERILPIFQKKQLGLILNINSLAGLKGSPAEKFYCTSKYGLRGFSNSLREQVNKEGIIITDIFLGAMNTKMIKHRKDFYKCISPKEVSNLILHLCKNYSTVKIDEIILTRRIY